MALRIAFVAFLPKRNVGVEKTLREKARAFALSETGVEVIVVNSWHDGQEGNLRYVRFAPRLPNLLRYPLTVFRRYRLIEDSVDLSPYDAIILRYPAADASGPRFMSRLPIVTEHHTRTLQEMESFGTFRLPVAERFMKRVRLYLERRYGADSLRNCQGIIGVTHEIRQSAVERAGPSLPSITVPNGINVAEVTATGFVPFDGDELHIAFVSAFDSPWNGLDRIAMGLREYSGEVSIVLHLIGNVRRTSSVDVETAQVNTEFHGSITGAELDEVLGKMNLAVTSLGLHRKQMEEACALKTREYVARGIPFVIGHRDPDLDQVPEDRSFFLPVAVDDSPIDIPAVIDFAREVAVDSSTSNLAEFMRDYAFEYMDWTPKLRQYVQFCESVMEGDEQ